LLLLVLGKEALKDFIDSYVGRTPSAAFPTDEAVQFRNFLQANPPPIAGLDDMLKFEASAVEAAANNSPVRLTLNKDIDSMLAELGQHARRACGRPDSRPLLGSAAVCDRGWRRSGSVCPSGSGGLILPERTLGKCSCVDPPQLSFQP